MKKKLYYKAVSVISEKDVFLSFATSGSFVLKYRIGETTKPNVGTIFIFDSLQNANEFISDLSCKAVLAGYATNVGKPKYVCQDYYSVGSLETFWMERKSKKLPKAIKTAPEGTMSCSSFTPIEIVQEG